MENDYLKKIMRNMLPRKHAASVIAGNSGVVRNISWGTMKFYVLNSLLWRSLGKDLPLNYGIIRRGKRSPEPPLRRM